MTTFPPRIGTRLLLPLVLVFLLGGAALRWGGIGRHVGASQHEGAALAVRNGAQAHLPPGGAKGQPGTSTRSAVQDKGTVVLAGSWGAQEGQFGRRQDAEANPEGPMALIAGGKGELLVLDQINRRVQRFSDGRPQGRIALGSDTAKDLAQAPGGRTVVLDPHVDRSVKIYDERGQLENEVPLTGKGMEEPGLVTGVFADRSGIYAEREHGQLVRLASSTGAADDQRGEITGRPSRDGRLLISAAIADRGAGQVRVDALDRASGQPLFSQVLQLPAPILHILLLDSDRQGRIYVAAATAHESPAPPYQLLDESITVVRLGSGGIPRGTLTLPPLTDAAQSERPLSVDDDGAVYLMRAQLDGLRVLRYVFP